MFKMSNKLMLIVGLITTVGMAAETTETVTRDDARNELLFGSLGSLEVREGAQDTVGLSLGYNLGVAPELQIGLLTNMSMLDLDTDNFKLDALLGPTAHLPLDGYDLTAFASVAGGVRYENTPTATDSTVPVVSASVGSRIQVVKNFNYRPNVSYTKYFYESDAAESQDEVVAFNLVSFSASF